MANLKISVKFAYNGRVKDDGTAPISLVLTYGGKRRIVNTGISIENKYFNASNPDAPCRTSYKQSAEVNARIRELKNKYQDRAAELQIKGDYFEIDDIVNIPERQSNDFINFIQIQAKYKRNKHGQAVGYEQQNAYKVLVENLQAFAQCKHIRFEKINLQFINEFDLWLRTTPSAKGKPLHINTIRHRHDILRSFVLLAVDEGYIKQSPYATRHSQKGFHYSGIESRRIHLTDEELKKIEDFKPLDSMELSKDLFLFGCYTGLRFADIMSLTRENVSNVDGKTFLTLREGKTQKVKNNLPISELHKGKAVALVEKYSDRNRATLFPKITDQAINRILKTIAGSTGINKEVSFHVSRHTFCTYIANHGGDALLIQDLCKHAKIETSLRYIHQSEKTQLNKLKNIDWN